MGFNGSSLFSGRGISLLLPILWTGMVTALFTICLVTVIRRFRDNLLRDEAYLTLTLPVPVWTLVASKAIAALCVSLVTALVVVFFIWAAMAIDNFTQMAEVLRQLSGLLSQLGTGIVVARFFTILIFIVQQLCLIYAILIASRMLPRFGGVAVWGAYLAVLFLVIQPVSQAVYRTVKQAANVPALLALCLVEAAFAALFFWLSTLLLRRTVNLE
jgi:hypothetical protein